MIEIFRNAPGCHVRFDLLREVPEFICLTTLSNESISAANQGLNIATGIPENRIVRIRQVHSDKIVEVHSPGDLPASPPEADGIIITKPGVFGVVATADCVPVVLVNKKARATAVIHAGWKGTSAGITGKAAARLLALTSGNPAEVKAFAGPCIHSCCYEIGDEVIENLISRGHDPEQIMNGRNLDLVRANLLQAQDLGIEDISSSGFCTSCNPDLFYSYRRNHTGRRMLTVAGFIPQEFP